MFFLVFNFLVFFEMKNFAFSVKRVFGNDVVKMVAVAAVMAGVYMLLEGCCGGEYGLAMGVIAGVAGGKHVEGEPLTLEPEPRGVARSAQE